MLYRVEVFTRPDLPDARGESLRCQAAGLGIVGLEAIRVSDLYFLEGDLDDATVARLCDALLYDPVVEQAVIQPLSESAMGSSLERPEQTENALPLCGMSTHAVEVALLPGVTDSVAESLLAGAAMIGVSGLARAATGRRYVVNGRVGLPEVRRLAEGLLANDVIQAYAVDRPIAPPIAPPQSGDGEAEIIPIRNADDDRLIAISEERRLALDLAEMQAIRAFYRREQREPTDLELEMLAQTWSEHCVHKTFKALIEYEELTPDGVHTYGGGYTEYVARTGQEAPGLHPGG